MTAEPVVYAHIVSPLQELLGHLGELLNLDLDAPHALCGVSLVDRSEPPGPDPSPGWPTCPACLRKQSTRHKSQRC